MWILLYCLLYTISFFANGKPRNGKSRVLSFLHTSWIVLQSICGTPCACARPPFLFIPSLSRFLASLSARGWRRTRESKKRKKKKKKKNEEKKRGIGCLEGGEEGKKEDEEEAHSVRETGCGQLFTSWRMIPRGVPLQNESSSRINRQKGTWFSGTRAPQSESG